MLKKLFNWYFGFDAADFSHSISMNYDMTNNKSIFRDNFNIGFLFEWRKFWDKWFIWKKDKYKNEEEQFLAFVSSASIELFVLANCANVFFKNYLMHCTVAKDFTYVNHFLSTKNISKKTYQAKKVQLEKIIKWNDFLVESLSRTNDCYSQDYVKNHVFFTKQKIKECQAHKAWLIFNDEIDTLLSWEEESKDSQE